MKLRNRFFIVLLALGLIAVGGIAVGAATTVPTSPGEQLLSQALALFGNDQLAAASAICEQVLAQYPDVEFDARLDLAEIDYSQGDFTGAIGQAQQALGKAQQASPSDPQRVAEAQAALARFQAAQGDFEAQEAPLQQTLSQAAPGSAQELQTRLALGRLLCIYGKRDLALEQYQAVMGEAPGSMVAVKASVAVQTLYADMCKSPQAIHAYQEIIDLCAAEDFGTFGTESVAALQAKIEAAAGSAAGQQAQYRLGCFYAHEVNYEKALAQFMTLLQAFPESVLAVRTLSAVDLVLQAGGPVPTGLPALLGQVQPRAAAQPEILLEVARLYQTLGQGPEARAVADSIVMGFPQSPEAPTALRLTGQVEGAAGDAAAMEAVAQKLFDSYPRSPDIIGTLQDLETFYTEHQGRVEAGVKLQQVAEAHPGTAVAVGASNLAGVIAGQLREEGLAAAEAHQYQQAIDLLNQSQSVVPDPELAYQVGICYATLGQKAAALTQFRRVQHDYPDSYLKTRAEQWIEKLQQG